MHITIVGAGYVGLVSGACLAELGANVTCVDMDADKIDRLRQGEVPIFEPGLAEMVARQTGTGRLSFTTDLSDAVRNSQAVFLAVGTPLDHTGRNADMSYIYQAVRDIARHVRDYTVIVTKSTVPVGTAREIKRIVQEMRPDCDFDICSNPEFLSEGHAINDFMNPERIVIGTDTDRARDVMRRVYQPFLENNVPVVETSPETAELSKYAANAFLATKVSFINQIADLCENAGADVQDIARVMGLDSRIGPKFLQAGAGYGGSCFPKDTQALLRIGEQYHAPQSIVESVVKANEDRLADLSDRVIAACGGSVRGRKVAVLGVSFKPGTDDIRGAPSLYVIPRLQEAGARVFAYDPVAMNTAENVLPGVAWSTTAYDAIEDADALVILTEWSAFSDLDLAYAGQIMRRKVLCDFRNVFDARTALEHGFHYTAIGRSRAVVEEARPQAAVNVQPRNDFSLR